MTKEAKKAISEATKKRWEEYQKLKNGREKEVPQGPYCSWCGSRKEGK